MVNPAAGKTSCRNGQPSCRNGQPSCRKNQLQEWSTQLQEKPAAGMVKPAAGIVKPDAGRSNQTQESQTSCWTVNPALTNENSDLAREFQQFLHEYISDSRFVTAKLED
ncbi:hypothetical protein F511_10833 [Dorcoceras hygrometricum]|uniref:Uncharacterized protein n=1 Tax=Dorcoceras hygrometricum TaxID=472368 RepID=A0A2Z7CI96_9LAMI|nr:hypothetical protein F511_10833 [Dorcoceras hygrometricum]